MATYTPIENVKQLKREAIERDTYQENFRR